MIIDYFINLTQKGGKDMKITITINGNELDLTEVDLNAAPAEIMDALVDALGPEIDPDFNGCYTALRQEY